MNRRTSINSLDWLIQPEYYNAGGAGMWATVLDGYTLAISQNIPGVCRVFHGREEIAVIAKISPNEWITYNDLPDELYFALLGGA